MGKVFHGGRRDSISNIQCPISNHQWKVGPRSEVRGARSEGRSRKTGTNRNTGRGEGTEDGGQGWIFLRQGYGGQGGRWAVVGRRWDKAGKQEAMKSAKARSAGVEITCSAAAGSGRDPSTPPSRKASSFAKAMADKSADKSAGMTVTQPVVFAAHGSCRVRLVLDPRGTGAPRYGGRFCLLPIGDAPAAPVQGTSGLRSCTRR